MQTFDEWVEKKFGRGYALSNSSFCAQAYNDAAQAAREDLMKASPCGQKFSDGTPHPMALWVDGLQPCGEERCPQRMINHAHPVKICLVCNTEDVLKTLPANVIPPRTKGPQV